MFLICHSIVAIRYKKALARNSEYTNAVIFDFSETREAYLKYVFFINETKYKGSGFHYPNSDILSIGDSIVIVYDRTNPTNNMTKRDFERYKLNFRIFF